MGNQTLIPSQIQSVETYFLDLKSHVQFKASLGSTTFMKTAKVILIDSNGVAQEEYILDSRLAAAMNVVGLGSGGVGTVGGGGGSDLSANNSNTNNLMLMNVGSSAMSPSASSSTLTNQQRQQTMQIRQRIQQLREQQQIVVVKIFPRYDMSIRLDLYSKRVKEIKHTIQNRYGLCTNCLPFHDLIITDKAAFLFRQFIKYNLYDRLSTRPFLTHIEKKWIAFQLLCAVNEIHALQIVHGDIKTENVLINSFLWSSLSDFASYKPVYLSKNHPSADFNYYFDISRRRTCYLAPERLDWSPKVADTRFQTNNSPGFSPPPGFSAAAADHDQSLPELMPPDPNDFKESMDIFSLGCVLAELFMERPLFDFAHLLSYRDGKYDPVPELKAEIKDESIFAMILSMISLEPSERKSANKYLQEQNDKAFPSYFVFLKSYISQFIKAGLNADEIVIKLKSDLTILLKNFKNESDGEPNSEANNTNSSMTQSTMELSGYLGGNSQDTNDAFLILLSVLLSSMRKLKFADNKLLAIDLIGRFSKFLDDSIVLDRILPYYLYFVDNEQQLPIVKSHVVYALNNCLSSIRQIDLLNLNIFPEIIFDKLDMLSRDDSYLVRSSVAKTISSFAETSRRFLDDGFLKRSQYPTTHGSGGVGDLDEHSARLMTNSTTSYDKEFEHYQSRVSEIVMHLMIDMNHSSSTSNAVKEALIRSDISRLCAFFGQLKTSEFLLPHMITILNEKTDWSIRAAFFDALCPVLLCIGWESVEIVKPLLEQGLKDGEEFVIYRTLISLARMVETGLLDRHQIIYFLSTHISPLLCHPSLWIRQGAVHYVVTICKQTKIKEASHLNRPGGGLLNTADILCSIAPLLAKFLQAKYSSLLFCYDRADVLFTSLKRPIKRAVYDCISQDGRSDNLFLYLNQRSEIRCLTHQDYLPAYVDCSDVNVQQFFEKLIKLGFLEEDEDKLLHMKEFIDKIRISRLSSSLFNTDGGMTASSNSTTSVVMNANNFTNSAIHLKENNNYNNNFSIKDGFIISIMKYQRASCEYLNTRTSPFVDLLDQKQQQQQIEVANSPETGSALPSRRDTLIDHYQLQAAATAPSAENVNAEWKMMFSGGGSTQRSSAEPDPSKTTAAQRQRQLHPSPSYDSGGGGIPLHSPNNSTRFYTAQPQSSRIPINALAKRFTDCTIEVEKYLDRCKFVYEEDKLRQAKVSQVRATINASISSNTISLLPSVGKWKPKGILVAHSNEHTKEINKISRNSDSTYFATCSAGEASVKLWATDNVLDGKSGFFKSVFTFDRSLPRTSNNSETMTSTMTPSCTSFFDKNSLAILCEDFRFYIIDFNSNRTQYYLHTHDRVFKPTTCRHFGLNANPIAANGFDKTTFYYLNRAFKKSSSNLKCGGGGAKAACYCESNFPIEMIYLNESSPSWQMSATNTYEYFRGGSNMKGLFCYSTSMGDVSCIDIRTRSKAFDVRRDLKNGYVTSMVTDPYYTWLAMGTSYGNIDIYDFRYMLPLQTFEHRSRSAVSRLCNHPLYSNRIVASYQSNNEISVWNMDQSSTAAASKSSFMNTSSSSSSTPEMVFWGVQSVPPLCQNKMSPSYITSMIGCSIGQDPGTSTAGLICSSTDMKLRYIDLVEPHRESFVISAPFNLATPQNVTNLSASAGKGSEFASSLMAQNVQYDTRQIEGNKVLLELDQQSSTSATSTNTGVSPTFSFNSSALTHQTYFTYHQDAITDLIVCYNSNNSKSQPLVISSSRDGALKVWR